MADPIRPPSHPARLYTEWAAVALAATLLVVALVVGRLTDRLDNIIYDRALIADTRPPPDDILVVAIDNRSLRAIGRWPWSRAVHTQALEQLARARPRTVGYDVLFVEPTADDARLAAAVRLSPTYLPVVLDVPGSNGAPYDIALPAGRLAGAAAGLAQVNLHFDGDKVIRKIYLEEGGDGRSWIQLGALMAGLRPQGDATRKRRGLWQSRPVLIPYGGPAGHLRTISFVDLLEGRVPAELIAGRHVLIGATAEGLGDSFPTPTSGTTSQMAGVEIQAHLLDALLRGKVIVPASGAMTLAAALGSLWLLLAGFLRLSPKGNARLALAIGAGWIIGSFGLLAFARYWLPPSAALIGLLFVYPLWGWRRLQAIGTYITDELDKLQREGDAFPRRSRTIAAQREVTLQAKLLQDAIDRLRDLRRFLADAIGALPDALFLSTLDGRLALANAEGERLGARLGVLVKHGADLRALLASMRSIDERPISPFAPGAGEQGVGEAATEDGGSFELRYVVQRDAANAPVGWIIRIVDIGPLKQAERHRDEALQLLSHDMRSPQSAILTLLDGPDTGVPKAVGQRIEKLARRTLELAEDFVQLARAESKPLANEPVDLNDVVIDAADALFPQARAQRIRVDVAGVDNPHFTDGDRQLLTRAVLNLIGNAIKYSEPGQQVRCRLTEADGAIRLSVEDDGAGMAAAQLGQLFTPFQQGPREGIGLGLTFVRTVVMRHHGRIACESEPGSGTCFTLCLPKSAFDPLAEED